MSEQPPSAPSTSSVDVVSESERERWQRVSDIVADALEIADPARRRAFVEAACGDDSALNAEVGQFLRLADSDAHTLERTQVAMPERNPVERAASFDEVNLGYDWAAALRLPLITHAGDERAVHGFGEHLGNPLRLRRPLDAGVKVVVAHCASLGEGHDTDKGGSALVPNFDLFARLMDEPAYRGNLVGDIAAVTQGNRMGVVATLLERRDWHDRLLNASDYPLPGVVPLIYLEALFKRKLLDPASLAPLRGLRDFNSLLFDFVLKRSLALNGQGFPAAVFETAPWFKRPN